MSAQQPEALALAYALESRREESPTHYINQAAAELRFLHAETERLKLYADGADILAEVWKGRTQEFMAQRDELLVALTKLVEDLELRSNWKRGKEKGVVDCGNSVYRNARTAIAKAIG